MLVTNIGAIKLALKVAQEMDRENAAVSWLKDGCPEQVREQLQSKGRLLSSLGYSGEGIRSKKRMLPACAASNCCS